MRKILMAALLVLVAAIGAASALGFGYGASEPKMGAAAGECAGYGHGYGKQNMGLRMIEREGVSQVEVSEEDIKAILESASFETFINPRGLVIERMTVDGEPAGKIVGDYTIDQLEILKAYKTLNGIKVFLGVGGEPVGFVLLR